MPLAKIEKVVGRGLHVPGEDVDTDRIIPARFLRCVTFDGLGERLFYDVRFSADGSKTDHPLNDARFAGATILIAGRNFGCGSSREHAPQSIAKYGFKAILAESFAEIFFGNSTTLGLVCASLPRPALSSLAAGVESRPHTLLTVDLLEGVVRGDDGFCSAFSMKQGARDALLSGTWDPIGQLLEAKDDIRRLGASIPYAKLGPRRIATE
jgi:3-isopropylmalate/(R)-2-methylmalate dehydratase small subunit